MKVYIAGKITGDPGYHYHFHKVERNCISGETSRLTPLHCRRVWNRQITCEFALP